jgi:excinuclease UvrABC ATPase subunit
MSVHVLSLRMSSLKRPAASEDHEDKQEVPEKKAKNCDCKYCIRREVLLLKMKEMREEMKSFPEVDGNCPDCKLFGERQYNANCVVPLLCHIHDDDGDRTEVAGVFESRAQAFQAAVHLCLEQLSFCDEKQIGELRKAEQALLDKKEQRIMPWIDLNARCERTLKEIKDEEDENVKVYSVGNNYALTRLE